MLPITILKNLEIIALSDCDRKYINVTGIYKWIRKHTIGNQSDHEGYRNGYSSIVYE